ncbi:hypothetical protein NB725_004372 [Pantoea ananatis]|uniref:hypothetical protein n=1 Tax=Pantoea ananas TaxID=553 RepID=UPI0021E8BD32|nr:hypothetical protein [Pantoea ananatis]MCW0309919.1 hypothetical protein [Pantoea ananatis]MCW0341599.1 hypothetical protein [Pantoea ananatis]MCW0360099.1 hypothetical protein [Pantoea ananatis]MCW0364762.1 hypothetical protein [Pantoea ananatis]MCW1777347.1 hypothetical protein [Pantoea ananatis]
MFVLILFLTAIFFVLGLYAGGWAWYYMSGFKYGTPGLFTLINQGGFSLTDRAKIMLPWAWCVAVAITFLPLVITVITLLPKSDSGSNLHGNARFANRRETKRFWYTGSEK